MHHDPVSTHLRRGLTALALGVASLPLASCGPPEVLCTLEPRNSVVGTVVNMHGRRLTPDQVTFSLDGREAGECRSGLGGFGCGDAGGGEYEVTVSLDGKKQIQSAEVVAGKCAVTEPAEMEFVFDTPECEHDGHCEVFVDACCSCGPPTLDTALAGLVGTHSRPACSGIQCGACPEGSSAQATVVPACVQGVCEAVDIRDQFYAACEDDADCTLIAASCLGFWKPATLENTFAIRADAHDAYRVCEGEGEGPADEDEPSEPSEPDETEVEAYCHPDGYCDLRPL